MKIGILTHSLKNNYGGLLQNYALQVVLKQMGHEVLTVDRMKNTPFSVKIKSILKRGLRKVSGENVKLRAWTTKKEDDIINQYTRGFVNRHISTTRTVYSSNDLENIHSEYGFDGYIVGSDQVWRRNGYGNDNEFLDFVSNVNDIKKIAYSASFGIDNWNYTKDETEKYARLAKLFDNISVREKSGIDLCKNYLGVEAIQMPDPTMLLDKEDYIDLVKKAGIQQSQGDLFTYILDRSNDKKKIVNEVSEQLSLTPFEVMPEQSFMVDLPKGQKFDINKCKFPRVEEWLRAFMDAKFVITDSFHGTVFALLFNKPFISIQNAKRGSTRFHSLLSLFDLQERLITDNDQFNTQLVFNKIDYSKVEEKRKMLKEQAQVFLTLALK